VLKGKWLRNHWLRGNQKLKNFMQTNNPAKRLSVKKKLSKAAILRGQNPKYIQKQREVWINDRLPNKRYAVKLSAKIRQKMSQSQSGKAHPWGQKLKGRKYSAIHCKRIGLGRKGMKLSEETKEKIRYAARGRIVRNTFPFCNTSIEIALQKELKIRGIKFKLKSKLFGQPDIIIPEKLIAIFADGDYWHADPTKYLFDDIIGRGHKASQIWEKDRIVTGTLLSMGWTVLRFWETDIKANPSRCVDEIERCLSEYELSSKGQ